MLTNNYLDKQLHKIDNNANFCFTIFFKMAHLSSGHLDIGAIRRTARSDIVDCLDKCVGSKVLTSTIMLHIIIKDEILQLIN